MKWLVTSALWMLSAAAAWALCPEGSSPDPLTAIRWSAEAHPGEVVVFLGVKNTSDKQVRMVDAEVYFVDALGRTLGDAPLSLDPDLQIFGDGANRDILSAPAAFRRLIGVAPEDGAFSAIICTRAVLFSDGSKVEY